MDQGAQRESLERVRRLPRHRIPKGESLSGPPPLTPEQARGWSKYADTSPLYQHLNGVVAADPMLLDVLNSMEHTPRQNILFAGVQYLMMRDGGGDLAPYYPNFAAHPLEMAEVDRPFRDFVLSRAHELVELGRTRFTQTNECRRCVALLPAIWATGIDRFHLIDLGTSAGLNLHLDRYRYHWGDVTWGPDSSVDLVTDNRGAGVTPRDIEILSRTGLDLDPVDAADPDDRRWLEALVWPEHHERRDRLSSALDVAAAHPVDMVAGDGLATLPETLRRIPADDPAVVVNSFTLLQLTPTSRGLLDDIVRDARADRSLCRVSMEWLDSTAEAADLEIDDGSGLRKIGICQPHGEWLDLFVQPGVPGV